MSSDCSPPTKKAKQCPSIFKSPRKRIELSSRLKTQGDGKDKVTFKYGNYSRYYGYRNMEKLQDARLDIFARNKELFVDKDILDVGCNIGLLTTSIAKDYCIKSIFGLDIDKALINKARKLLQRTRKTSVEEDKTKFPFNISFVHGNYVVPDPILLQVPERYQFDLILCLSVTKWIHLNFGDAGLKLAFKRMFKQLKPGGRLLLEAQPWAGYKRRKKLTPEIEANFKNISFHPKDFSNYLLSDSVGFAHMHELAETSHAAKGFQRQLQVFVKSEIILTK